MSAIYERSGELTVNRCWCGIQHAIPKSLNDEQKRQHTDGRRQTSIYCPLGHSYITKGEGAAQKLERRLSREQAAHDQTRAELEHTERQRRAEKAAKTRIKNRIKAGVCPCCNRTFQNVARHMKTKHPTFSSD